MMNKYQDQDEIQFKELTPGNMVSPIGQGLTGPFEFKSALHEWPESEQHLMTGEFINVDSNETQNRYPSSLENPPRHEGAASILKKRLAQTSEYEMDFNK